MVFGSGFERGGAVKGVRVGAVEEKEGRVGLEDDIVLRVVVKERGRWG